MNAQALLKKMRAQREVLVPLDGDKSVTLLRPTDAHCYRELMHLVPAKNGVESAVELQIDTATLHTFAVGWSGFTEADLLGANGGSDAVEFDAALLQEYLANHMPVANALVDALYKAIAAHIEAKTAAEKN